MDGNVGMTDQELANELVARGVGQKNPKGGSYYFDGPHSVSAKKFVRDWRVAGACLEVWPTTINVEHLDMTLDEMLRDPRAINEAYAAALT